MEIFVKMRTAFFLSLGLALVAQAPPRMERAQSVPVTDAIADDPAVAKVIAPLAAEIRASFGKELTVAPQGLFRGRNGEENLLGYWVADLMRERAHQFLGVPVRFAITNSGGLRGNIRPGGVKVSDIYEVMPFENELVVAEYSGAEVIQIVKEGILRRQGEPCSGVKVEISGTVTQPEFSIRWSDGTPINPEERVKVALTDYLLSSGDGMSVIQRGCKPVTTGIPLRDLLLDACVQLGKLKAPLLAPSAQRYVIPPDIRQAIRDKKFSW